MIGNFLEKPTVLLKRNFIRDTTFSQEQLNAGTSYDKVSASMAPMMDAKARDYHPMKKMMAFSARRSSGP